ncbi:ribosome biogenesis GTPase Der [Parasulfuritortus cantonensis]|uniref:GTPase Der n=1 Tax=Parasulfuritortus cantonensis TaxID=2528202 RepID=A0A4R1BL00_9PROT|nr:ribosome biogenesis GTPase Der [Parasulfuritortus cantonensis]TCJ17918.1 ribosome biogenesis GTPase Der [Parasulfuritortus cantonensis]
MKPTIVLVGRPNVGKSTLFNRLTKTRAALVHDQPGLTRDRHYGHGRVGGKPYLVVDTGGFEPVVDGGILAEMARQTLQAVDEGDAIVFLVDGRAGATPQDKIIADRLRRTGRPVFVAVNKTEGMRSDVAVSEFHELGLGAPYAVSGAHGEGVRELMELVLEAFEAAEDESVEDHPRIAIVGRPNVGKSTLVNTLVGEERVIAFDQPGTTRDSIYVEFERAGRKYTLIDTAGVRRKGKVTETVEKFSVIKTLQAIEDANVAVLVLDAKQDIAEQDAHLAGFILEAGRALVVAINKWDDTDDYRRNQIKQELARKLDFLSFAKFHYISALKNTGVPSLLKSIDEAYRAAMIKLPTPRLTAVLQEAVARHNPARAGQFRPKPKYAHQGGMNPPVIVVHGNHMESLEGGYQRYLENCFREAFEIQGTPLRVEFRTGHNPFENRKPKAPPSKDEVHKALRLRRQRTKKFG